MPVYTCTTTTSTLTADVKSALAHEISRIHGYDIDRDEIDNLTLKRC
jgi:hypothetical protein